MSLAVTAGVSKEPRDAGVRVRTPEYSVDWLLGVSLRTLEYTEERVLGVCVPTLE